MANLTPARTALGPFFERHEMSRHPIYGRSGYRAATLEMAVSFEAIDLRGQAATKSEAVADAERAIDRALAPKKLRLVPPTRER
jgi:hypothetical protein